MSAPAPVYESAEAFYVTVRPRHRFHDLRGHELPPEVVEGTRFDGVRVNLGRLQEGGAVHVQSVRVPRVGPDNVLRSSADALELAGEVARVLDGRGAKRKDLARVRVAL